MSNKLTLPRSSRLGKAARNCPLLDGREEAWIACCSRRFLPLAKRIAGDDEAALDALQESWIKVLQGVHAYRGGPPACAWVRAIIANSARDIHRHQHGEVPLPEEPDQRQDPGPSAEDQAVETQLLLLLEEIVFALPETYRQVLELRYGQERSTEETAELLHISRSNVATRLDRAVSLVRKRVKERLEAAPPQTS